MSIEKLKEFIQLAKDENVSELSFEDKTCKMKVSLGQTVVAPMNYSQPMPTATPATNEVTTPSVSKSNYKEIKSPFVGTFYSSPSPDKPAYVKVGDKVGKGQTLCILEAMKIMNEIDSDVDGEIVEVCVTNESLVEFGQTLFKIK